MSNRTIYFTSDNHRARFIAAIEGIGKAYGPESRYDVEYASSLYILTAFQLRRVKLRAVDFKA